MLHYVSYRKDAILMKMQFADALEKAQFWSKTLDYFCAHISEFGKESYTVIYRKPEVVSFDPRVWSVLQELSLRVTPGQNQIEAKLVRMSVDYLVNGVLPMPDTKGNMHYTCERLAIMYRAPQDFARITVNTYVMGQTSDGTPYVIDNMWAHPNVPTSWLDETFPGWKKRWEVSQALEYASKPEQTAYILSKQPVDVDVHLDDISLM